MWPLLKQHFDPGPDNTSNHAVRNQSFAGATFCSIKMHDSLFLNS